MAKRTNCSNGNEGFVEDRFKSTKIKIGSGTGSHIMSKINPSLIIEIERLYSQLRSKDRCWISNILHNRHLNSMEKEAEIHSCKIELMNQSIAQYDPVYRKKKTDEGVKDLKNAFSWGYVNFDPNKLNDDYIQKLGFMAEPFLHDVKGERRQPCYRTGAVRVDTANWTPPSPTKVPTEMEKYIIDLQSLMLNEGVGYWLEAAAYAHLHLVRIHPFDDGNGRTSRTLQNIILRKKNLPPVVIHSGERQNYYEHLNNAITSGRYSTGNPFDLALGRGEHSFYNYIAGRVLTSLEKLL